MICNILMFSKMKAVMTWCTKSLSEKQTQCTCKDSSQILARYSFHDLIVLAVWDTAIGTQYILVDENK